MDVGMVGSRQYGLRHQKSLLARRASRQRLQPHTLSRGRVNSRWGHRCRHSRRMPATATPSSHMLADDAAVESAVFGSSGILSALPQGGLHISQHYQRRSQ